MKKILTILLCLLVIAGCSKKEPEIVYDYDYFDYLDIEFIGPDGYATMDVNIADFSVADFKSEEDFIKMKKVMNLIYQNLNWTGKDSEAEAWSNGDVAQIGIMNTLNVEELGDMSINLSPREIPVTNLAAPKILDLYDTSNVVFYGLEGTGKVYYYFPINSSLSSEVKENIDFVINIDDSEVYKNKTILTLEAKLNDELLTSKRQYGTLTRYFGFNGYVVEETSEKTLKNTVNEKALEKLDKVSLRKEVEEKIKEDGGVEGYDLKQVLCIQKCETPYEYYAVALFKNTNEDKTIYVKYSATMAYVDNKLVFYTFSRDSTTDENYATNPFGDATMLYKYEIFEIVETPAEENVENSEAAAHE